MKTTAFIIKRARSEWRSCCNASYSCFPFSAIDTATFLTLRLLYNSAILLIA